MLTLSMRRDGNWPAGGRDAHAGQDEDGDPALAALLGALGGRSGGAATAQELQAQYGLFLTVDALPLGLFSVTVNRRGSYERYVCEPARGRCSCRAGSTPCLHIAATLLRDLPRPEPVYPLLQRRGRARSQLG